ncbi:uncharacterized protein LOC129582349 [Paramacrobiotus metropolitanus]|uniref:uncharacterized protein LOC129582349 n=1 Tax=Paramacrobiotus metropolitanus TaxID=2943436 RepID=UPI002445A7BB|nr:uncharacterized protein LOC129582349 [Paramacrobiotus metropolitanus]
MVPLVPGSRPWDSVLVLGDDGLFRYGCVVDVADHGLFIDFLCPTRQREFTPFDRVLLSDNRYLDRHELVQTGIQFEMPTEVLMRDSASGTRTWFPAELLIRNRNLRHTDYNVAVVDYGYPEELADVVSMSRIRWKAPTHWRRPAVRDQKVFPEGPEQIETWTFFKQSKKLPDGCPAELVTAALKQYGRELLYHSRWYSVKIVDVDNVDGSVMYMQRRSKPKEECDDILMAKEREALDEFHAKLISFVSRAAEPLLKISVLEEFDRLPVELWTEVISYLDTFTQTKLRSVCATWNLILNSASCTAVIVLDSAAFGKAELCGISTPTYFMISTLFKHVSTSTQYTAVIISQEWRSVLENWEMDIVEVFDMLKFIAQRKPGIKLKAIYLFGMRLCLVSGSYGDHQPSECQLHQSLSAYTSNALTDSIVACRSFLDAIHLIKCTVAIQCMYETQYYPRLWKLTAQVYIKRQRFTGDIGGALWSAVENGLSIPSSTELRRLSEFMASSQAYADLTSYGRVFVAIVSRTLCATQTVNPRPSLHYCGKKWCLDGLQGLELEKLSPVTLYFLVQLMESLPH